ncbi:MAG: hypothetical protein EHM20_00340 [Alphaproteobacteria bacterium]|nr:MAG: hypothetical protein EHM20_00340 [Alphaproteobacteria bacterium]
MNKKGQGFNFLLSFFIVIGILLAVSLFISFIGVIIDMFMDEFVPTVQDIGVVGDSNITQYANYGLTPVNNLTQSFTWLGGLIYAVCLILLLGLCVAGRFTMNRWLIGLFFGFALLLILMSIFISNIYEDFYNDTGDIAERLQSQTLLSWLILHSPIVFTVIIFIGGIIMFSGINQDEYV